MKETTKHTPGPWHYRYRFFEGDRYGGSVDSYAVTADLGNITIAETLFSWKDDEANARLIAAAPDLLEACEMALEFISGIHNEGEILGMPWPEEQQLEAAIRKAKGDE